MLSIGKVGPANADYYVSSVVAGVEDYYAGDGDAPGVWVGRADSIGAVAGSLATAVDAKLLLEAKCAPDGMRLGTTVVSERSVTAFDLTFSAPKSASVLYALGNRAISSAVEAAFTAAVDQAVASLSPRIAYTRTGHAGAAVVDADGAFGIRYRHRTSRALDPQLHDHVLIANALRTTSDGEWRTLDARGLYRNAKAAGVEFQSFFRSALRASLGVEFGEVDANGQADIVGIDRAVLEDFSTRSVDIERALAVWTSSFVDREGRRPTSAEVGKAHKTIVLATRPAKPGEAELSTATLRDRWRARADRLVDVDAMLESTVGNVLSPAVIVRPTGAEVLAVVETRHAEWSESQLIEQIAMRTSGPDPATIADTIDAVRREIMASADVVDLTAEAEPGEIVRFSDGRPVGTAPSAVRYTTRAHLDREIELVEWATTGAMARHRRHDASPDVLHDLDRGQVAAVVALLDTARPVVTVVGPAGAGKTRMLAAAVESWRRAGVHVFGVGPSATSAQQLSDGAGTAADTLHKLVYEHRTKWIERREPPDQRWWVPPGSVVIIDEAGMVGTRLLHQYAQIARRNHWRTVLVGDHHQLDPVDAGGMFAEFVEHDDVPTVELDTLHRFEHDWEADASRLLRNGDQAAIDIHERHGRIHGHTDEQASIDAVADAVLVGHVEGRVVLAMASSNRVVELLNRTVTDRLLARDRLDPAAAIDIAQYRFYVGQPVVTRANDRRLTCGPDDEHSVRNGDRWTVIAGNRDELILRHCETGHHQAIPAAYVEASNVAVDYASTIQRAQGATIDEAHLIVSEHTDAKQLYVGTTRGRASNHIHASPPALGPDHHGLDSLSCQWIPAKAVLRSLTRQAGRTAALERRRRLRAEAGRSRVAEVLRAGQASRRTSTDHRTRSR